MTASLTAIVPKLEKLLPLLASDRAGEVVATAAAIGRTLRTVGADWHDLTRALTRPAPSIPPPPPDPPPGAPRWRDVPEAFRPRWLERMIASPVLTPWETAFCGSISDQLRAGSTLSEKQVGVLDRILRKVAEARR